MASMQTWQPFQLHLQREAARAGLIQVSTGSRFRTGNRPCCVEYDGLPGARLGRVAPNLVIEVLQLDMHLIEHDGVQYKYVAARIRSTLPQREGLFSWVNLCRCSEYGAVRFVHPEDASLGQKASPSGKAAGKSFGHWLGPY